MLRQQSQNVKTKQQKVIKANTQKVRTDHEIKCKISGIFSLQKNVIVHSKEQSRRFYKRGYRLATNCK